MEIYVLTYFIFSIENESLTFSRVGDSGESPSRHHHQDQPILESGRHDTPSGVKLTNEINPALTISATF